MLQRGRLHSSLASTRAAWSPAVLRLSVSLYLLPLARAGLTALASAKTQPALSSRLPPPSVNTSSESKDTVARVPGAGGAAGSNAPRRYKKKINSEK